MHWSAWSQTQARILLVDDSITALMIEKMLLAKAPYEVITARDGHYMEVPLRRSGPIHRIDV